MAEFSPVRVCLPRPGWSPLQQGDAFSNLAQVLEAAGRRDKANAAWHEALDRYERKGIIPLARRTRDRLSALREAPI